MATSSASAAARPLANNRVAALQIIKNAQIFSRITVDVLRYLGAPTP